MDHKINPCKKFIPQAFPTGQDIILDSEIIMVNRETGELLPFGSLGVHKREQFADAEVCLFIFDCIYYNGEDLTKRPLKERKKILEANIKPIKNHVQLSEYQLIKTEKELASMTAKVLKAGLEGLVLKNVNGLYQPGKRGWLKVKKDYLCEGQMADTADLVVLGAWFGTGKKGGMLSIFLMGCFDSRGKVWKTVTKVHSGLDDREMEDLQDELKDLMERADPDVPPSWLHCKKALIPDFIAKNPNVMPVWEITGAEFSKSDAHTASGISIRFPRITRIRRDKSTKDATNLKELEKLFETSKDNINVDMLFKGISTKTGAGTGDISDSKKKNNDIMTKFLGGKVKRRSSVDDIESTSPSKRIKKELSESGSSGVENVKRENVFKGLLLYIKFDGKDMEQNDFIEMGGEITENKAVAEVVIHDTMTIEPNDLENYRKLYSKHCRHVGFKWLQDSLESKKIMPFGFYAVEIC